MSATRNDNEDQMLLRLIALEEEKIRANANAPRLTPDRIEAVKSRLLAEKDEILAEFDLAGALRVQKKSGARKIWASVGAAAALVIGVGVVMLLRGPGAVDAQLALVKGDVKLGNAPVAAGAKLQKESVLTTGAKALAVAKWDEPLWILANQNTKIAVRKIERAGGKPAVNLESTTGLAFAQLDKGRAEFTMRTPTAVLVVRGTAFSVETTADGTVVNVLEGVVESTPENKFLETVKDTAPREKLSRPVSILPRQKLVISQLAKSAVVSALTEAEVALLTKMSKLIALAKEKQTSDAKRAAAIDAEVNALAGELSPAAPTGAPPAQKLTLADIRAKYGKVSKVNLKNGKSYVGFFTLQGAQMQIITPYGTVRVPTAELQDVQDM